MWQDGWVKRPSSIFRPPRRHRTREEIAEIIVDQRRSGLSLLAFARKRGLCYGSLLRWISWQRKGASVPRPPGDGAGPRFVPVKIETEGLGEDYVLSLPGGRSLRIPPRFETDSLRRLLAVLEAAR